MIPTDETLRETRANLLCDAAATGMGVMIDTHPDCQGASAADVCNGALTLANRTIVVILKLSTPGEELKRNRASLKQAVLQLLMTTATDEAPKG